MPILEPDRPHRLVHAGGARYYFVPDGLGSTIATTGTGGAIVNSYKYDPLRSGWMGATGEGGCQNPNPNAGSPRTSI